MIDSVRQMVRIVRSIVVRDVTDVMEFLNTKERRQVVLSKGSKKQFKQFEMTSIEEACLIMRGLLVPVITDIGKFKRYSQEAIELLDKCNAVASIPGEEYDSIHDKLLYQQRELLRFIADNQSSSFSY